MHLASNLYMVFWIIGDIETLGAKATEFPASHTSIVNLAINEQKTVRKHQGFKRAISQDKSGVH
jgi:hypothetical protein